jgi:hypothetical protein
MTARDKRRAGRYLSDAKTASIECLRDETYPVPVVAQLAFGLVLEAARSNPREYTAGEAAEVQARFEQRLRELGGGAS